MAKKTGNQKQKWTPEEESALRGGVERYGMGKWKLILKDAEFAPFLVNRSNIDLKDKWRNVSSHAGTYSSRRAQTPSVYSSTTDGANAPAASAVALGEDDKTDNPSSEKNPCSRDNAQIFEAIQSLNHPYGSNISSIMQFIEERYQVPHNFKRVLGDQLRKLVREGKLEKVRRNFRIKDNETSMEEQPQNSAAAREKLAEKAAASAALVAQADNDDYMLKEAVEELDKVMKLVEESETTLEIAKLIHERTSRGELVYI